MFAHSTSDPSRAGWEPLKRHHDEVADFAGAFAAVFGWKAVGAAMGGLHDIGKASAEYQAYISTPREEGRKGPDHSTAGAREAEAAYGTQLGRMLAYAIAGHHAGLADFAELRRRVRDKAVPDYARWREHTGELAPFQALWPTRTPTQNGHAGFTNAFLTRMLFSCLVDADFLATERFYSGQGREAATPLATLQGALASHLAGMRTEDTALNRLRRRVLQHAVEKSALEPGLFTLTVPTGGGKTLTSLAFAMEHARRHGLRRVIFVIPYTSIIEQTAAVFRRALGTDDAVLEHHASFDFERRRDTEDADAEGPTGVRKLRHAAENWDAPVVVTTAVQFFESLFARRTSQCRKLHNIAGAVVVLDEAQTLPLRLLSPCMAALNELAANYGASVVLCTATQPALRTCDGFEDVDLKRNEARRKIGFKIDDTRELAPDPKALFTEAAVRRVAVERRGPQKTTDAEIVARFAEAPRMLCIVNNRRHARDLYDMLKADARTAEGARHLTTLMCPVHRRAVLAEVKARLADQLPVRLVSTSLIEAGVDVDFPEVWRALAGLDQIAQAAGRCNREGRLAQGRTVVFDPEKGAPPRDLDPLIDCAKGVFRAGLDPLSLEGVAEYFRTVYWRRGAEGLDCAKLGDNAWPILPAIAARANDFEFDFETISRVFRMIEDAQATVIVPYDADAEKLLKKVEDGDRPHPGDLRKLQQYAVSIPRHERDEWLRLGVLRPVHRRLGDDMLRFEDRESHYRDDTGVDLREPERRDATANIM